MRFAPGTGLPGEVLAAVQPVWVEELEGDAHFVRGRSGPAPVRAAFALPVLIGREVAGVLEFFCDRPTAPDHALLEAMTHIGVQLGRVVERSRAREALRSSEAKFAGIIAISSDAIVSTDEEQRITLFNQGAENIFGYAAEEVLGRPLDVLIPERSRAGHQGQVRGFGDSPVVARRMGERGRISGRRSNGEVFPADASISKLELGGRRIYTAVLRDVTDRVRGEEELAARSEELERSNRELEQFAYVASHDLQEPLRMVASYTQLLARRYRGRLDEDAEEFIGYAVDGVTRMQALINDLLAYSRVGTRGGAFEPVEVGAVMERVLASLGPAMEDAGATVTRDPLPTVRGDAGQLGQLLQNLVGNAVKFRGEAPPRVHVSAERAGDEWAFAVADNGIGIDPEYAERIFVIFQRLHTRGEYPGTGIGLAICKKIVERHGGRIWFEPAPRRGDRLPLHPSGPGERPRMSSQTVSRPVEVLLVEDNPGDVRLTREALKEGRIRSNLHVARDGVEALAFLRRRGEYAAAPRPDLILLDLNLPRKDGREVLTEIKEDAALRQIPVVVLTSSQAEEDICRAYDLHANCYITKPVDLDQFINVVRSIEDFWFTVVKLPPE